ncbi:MAG: hypothetical protein CMN60_21110 [Sphingobium sp.]|mgnify:CR=1 FL=1|nr:hypothetical protein [Sphingobium sp.]MBS50131.1 hypothetical protein [Sphingobium sp.]|tara:strand:+ start:1425 stop:1655 length:231 start_codon:yes stop_codon:yes gene_type:complete
MSSGQQYWHDKQADEAAEELAAKRQAQASRLGVPVELGLAIKALDDAIGNNTDGISVKAYNQMSAHLDKILKYKIS